MGIKQSLTPVCENAPKPCKLLQTVFTSHPLDFSVLKEQPTLSDELPVNVGRKRTQSDSSCAALSRCFGASSVVSTWCPHGHHIPMSPSFSHSLSAPFFYFLPLLSFFVLLQFHDVPMCHRHCCSLSCGPLCGPNKWQSALRAKRL